MLNKIRFLQLMIHCQNLHLILDKKIEVKKFVIILKIIINQKNLL